MCVPVQILHSKITWKWRRNVSLPPQNWVLLTHISIRKKKASFRLRMFYCTCLVAAFYSSSLFFNAIDESCCFSFVFHLSRMMTISFKTEKEAKPKRSHANGKFRCSRLDLIIATDQAQLISMRVLVGVSCCFWGQWDNFFITVFHLFFFSKNTILVYINFLPEKLGGVCERRIFYLLRVFSIQVSKREEAIFFIYFNLHNATIFFTPSRKSSDSKVVIRLRIRGRKTK